MNPFESKKYINLEIENKEASVMCHYNYFILLKLCLIFPHFVTKSSNYWHKGNLRKLTTTFITTVTIKQVVRKLFFCLFNRAYSIIANEDNLNKENTRIKQVSSENG